MHFPKEVRDEVVRIIVPHDRRDHRQMTEITKAVAEMDQGLPENIISLLEAKGRALGQERHDIDAMIERLGPRSLAEKWEERPIGL